MKTFPRTCIPIELTTDGCDQCNRAFRSRPHTRRDEPVLIGVPGHDLPAVVHRHCRDRMLKKAGVKVIPYLDYHLLERMYV